MTHNEVHPIEAKLTAEQKKMIDQLSEENLRRIDLALLSNASTQWSGSSLFQVGRGNSDLKLSLPATR